MGDFRIQFYLLAFCSSTGPFVVSCFLSCSCCLPSFVCDILQRNREFLRCCCCCFFSLRFLQLNKHNCIAFLIANCSLALHRAARQSWKRVCVQVVCGMWSLRVAFHIGLDDMENAKIIETHALRSPTLNGTLCRRRRRRREYAISSRRTFHSLFECLALALSTYTSSSTHCDVQRYASKRPCIYEFSVSQIAEHDEPERTIHQARDVCLRCNTDTERAVECGRIARIFLRRTQLRSTEKAKSLNCSSHCNRSRHDGHMCTPSTAPSHRR